MREIKLRLWDRTEKEMIYLDKVGDRQHHTFGIRKDGNLYYYNLQNGSGGDEYILMQYTGLKDKNGKEIYEGDILKLINDAGRRVLAICKFGNRRLTTENGDMIDIQCFYFEVEGRKTNPMVRNYKGVHDLEIMEVIGNIHDNPDLLEGEG